MRSRMGLGCYIFRLRPWGDYYDHSYTFKYRDPICWFLNIKLTVQNIRSVMPPIRKLEEFRNIQ